MCWCRVLLKIINNGPLFHDQPDFWHIFPTIFHGTLSLCQSFSFRLTVVADFVSYCYDDWLAQMIDLYWTVIPVMLVHCFATHPASHFDFWRSRVALLLTWVWSIRLTHSYFRREKWQLGAREDWRFTDMSRQYGKHWWWISFFAVYLSQQVPK